MGEGQKSEDRYENAQTHLRETRSSRRSRPARGNERSRFRLSFLAGIQSEALFGPRQRTLVHYLRVQRWRGMSRRLRTIPLEEQTWSMRPSAAKIAAPLIPVPCFATRLFRPPAGPSRK